MSNHFTGLSLGPPMGDQRLDLCDLYAFQSPADPARTAIILNANPIGRRLPSGCALSRQHRHRRRFPDGHRLQLRVLAGEGRQAERQRLPRQGSRGALAGAGGDQDRLRCGGLVRQSAEHRQVGRLHVLLGSAQRRLLLRFRRHQESVRHPRQAELHRAARDARQIAVDRRRFEHRGQRVLDGGRAADPRARRPGRCASGAAAACAATAS